MSKLILPLARESSHQYVHLSSNPKSGSGGCHPEQGDEYIAGGPLRSPRTYPGRRFHRPTPEQPQHISLGQPISNPLAVGRDSNVKSKHITWQDLFIPNGSHRHLSNQCGRDYPLPYMPLEIRPTTLTLAHQAEGKGFESEFCSQIYPLRLGSSA